MEKLKMSEDYAVEIADILYLWSGITRKRIWVLPLGFVRKRQYARRWFSQEADRLLSEEWIIVLEDILVVLWDSTVMQDKDLRKCRWKSRQSSLKNGTYERKYLKTGASCITPMIDAGADWCISASRYPVLLWRITWSMPAASRCHLGFEPTPFSLIFAVKDVVK